MKREIAGWPRRTDAFEMARKFGEMGFGPGTFRRFEKMMAEPFVDSFETDKEVVATAELPGVKKSDLTLRVTETGLSIKVEHREKQEHERKIHGGVEYSSSSRFEGFSRYVSFSSPVDAAKAKASYKNGVLEVRVPKIAQAKGRELKIE